MKAKEVQMLYLIDNILQCHGYIFLCTPKKEDESPFYYYAGRIASKEFEADLKELNFSQQDKDLILEEWKKGEFLNVLRTQTRIELHSKNLLLCENQSEGVSIFLTEDGYWYSCLKKELQMKEIKCISNKLDIYQGDALVTIKTYNDFMGFGK